MGKIRRLSLSEKLKVCLGVYSANLYFEPPDNVQMKYPCIVYERDNDSVKHADNKPYALAQRYQVTYIDPNPEPKGEDPDVIQALREMPYSAFSRHFATSGLNHDVFVIYD